MTQQANISQISSNKDELIELVGSLSERLRLLEQQNNPKLVEEGLSKNSEVIEVVESLKECVKTEIDTLKESSKQKSVLKKVEEVHEISEEITVAIDDQGTKLTTKFAELDKALEEIKSLSEPLRSLRSEIVRDMRMVRPVVRSDGESIPKKHAFYYGISVALVTVLLAGGVQYLVYLMVPPSPQITQETYVGKLFYKAIAKMKPSQKADWLTALAKEMDPVTPAYRKR